MQLPKFNNQKLLEQIFIHRSYLNETDENLESNERLEFLGDSILSFIVSSNIYKKYTTLPEGELTNLRSVLTNTETLYLISKSLGLGEHLKLSKGEEAGHGRENKTILANTLEALIGGLYIDQGIEPTKKFVEDVILSIGDELVKSQGLKDAKSKLQEILQEKHKSSPSYRILSEEGPDHAKTYKIGVFLHEKLLAQGIGKSKQEAEKEAAKNALLATQ